MQHRKNRIPLCPDHMTEQQTMTLVQCGGHRPSLARGRDGNLSYDSYYLLCVPRSPRTRKDVVAAGARGCVASPECQKSRRDVVAAGARLCGCACF